MAFDPSVLDRLVDFRDLDDAGRAALAERMHRKRFRRGESLIRILERVEGMYLVLDGLAGLETVSVNGVRRIVWVYRPGDLIGSRTFLEDRVDDSEVRTLTDLEAAVLAASDLDRINRTHPEVGLAVARILTGRLERMAERLLAATTLEVKTRLARLLLEFASAGADEEEGDGFRPLTYAMTHETMAEIVGASRPHISATIGELEDRGALKRGRGGKLVVHPETLARVVDSGQLETA